LSPRDNTPEALKRLIERELPGVAEAIRSYGQERNSFAMLSRGVAGVRQKTVIISLPGALTAVEDGLTAIFPAITHAFAMIEGAGHAHGHDDKRGHGDKQVPGHTADKHAQSQSQPHAPVSDPRTKK
jgi:molybdopterin biosynthesis enzyme MoaB